MSVPAFLQDAPSIALLEPRLTVVVLTAITGVGLTVISNLLRRKTDRLSSVTLYVRILLIFAGAAVVVVVLADRTGISQKVTTQSLYAVLLGKLTDQVAVLVYR